MTKFISLLIALAAFSAEAKQFKTQFFSLNLPPNWDCSKEELDWVCQPDNLFERSEVILIIVTKAADPVDDTIEKYKQVLNQPRPMRDLLGNPYTSEVRYARLNTIHEREWMDSLQYGSEIPGFYTRYLASVADKVAGLITYAIAESAYTKWAPVMEEMVGTIELKFDAQAFEELSKQSGSLLSARGGSRFGGRTAPPPAVAPTEKGSGDNGSTMILLALILAAVAGFIIYKRKKNS